MKNVICIYVSVQEGRRSGVHAFFYPFLMVSMIQNRIKLYQSIFEVMWCYRFTLNSSHPLLFLKGHYLKSWVTDNLQQEFPLLFRWFCIPENSIYKTDKAPSINIWRKKIPVGDNFSNNFTSIVTAKLFKVRILFYTKSFAMVPCSFPNLMCCHKLSLIPSS